MGGGHHDLGPKMAIPDYRIYKVEDVPELVKVQKALAEKGLKDPWLRNEVWRYNPKEWGTPKQRLNLFFFRGFKYGFAAFLATIALEKVLGLSSHDDHHGHGGGGHH